MPASIKSTDPSLLWCTKCKDFLPLDQFWPDRNAGEARRGEDGIKRATRCKECKIKEYVGIDPRRKILYNARNRAKARNIECDLTVDDIVIPELCPVLGIPLVATVGEGRVPMQENTNAPTLDRIDPSKGYVRGNVMVISARANFLKADASLSEAEAVYRYMALHLR